MSKFSLAFVGVVALVAAVLTPSFIVHAQGTTRFEYARLTPFIERTVEPNTMTGRNISRSVVMERVGYRGCVARATGWDCQEFKPNEPSSDALRIALVQFGNDGWELVSAAQEEQNNVLNGALTYLFKRPMR